MGERPDLSVLTWFLFTNSHHNGFFDGWMNVTITNVGNAATTGDVSVHCGNSAVRVTGGGALTPGWECIPSIGSISCYYRRPIAPGETLTLDGSVEGMVCQSFDCEVELTNDSNPANNSDGAWYC